jgi:hypothetical protein
LLPCVLDVDGCNRSASGMKATGSDDGYLQLLYRKSLRLLAHAAFPILMTRFAPARDRLMARYPQHIHSLPTGPLLARRQHPQGLAAQPFTGPQKLPDPRRPARLRWRDPLIESRCSGFQLEPMTRAMPASGNAVVSAGSSRDVIQVWAGAANAGPTRLKV